jgi:hypothetical protein
VAQASAAPAERWRRAPERPAVAVAAGLSRRLEDAPSDSLRPRSSTRARSLCRRLFLLLCSGRPGIRTRRRSRCRRPSKRCFTRPSRSSCPRSCSSSSRRPSRTAMPCCLRPARARWQRRSRTSPASAQSTRSTRAARASARGRPAGRSSSLSSSRLRWPFAGLRRPVGICSGGRGRPGSGTA